MFLSAAEPLVRVLQGITPPQLVILCHELFGEITLAIFFLLNTTDFVLS